jgi:hypothetical protein
MSTNETVSDMKEGPQLVPANVPTSEEVHYRVISGEELERLGPLMNRLGWPTLDPEFSKVVVAEAGEGESALICGFGVVQFVPHAEPMWVDPNLRGTGVAEELVSQVQHYIEVDCKIKRYVCVAKPGSFAARLCEKHGMVPYNGQVYVRQVE